MDVKKYLPILLTFCLQYTSTVVQNFHFHLLTSKIKFMKKISIIVPLLVGAVLYTVLSSNSYGPGTASGMERTGVTGMSGCAGACHTSPTGGSISDTIILLHAGAPVTYYIPGQSYTVRITSVNTSTAALILPRFGFQLTAVKMGTFTNAGAFTAPVGTHTVTPVAGVLVVEHSDGFNPTTGTGAVGSIYTVDIPWTAPAAGTGTVSFRNAVNVVNYDSTSGGDVFNNALKNITEGSLATSSVNTAQGHLNIYPNPVNRLVNLNLESPVNEKVHVLITNISGQQVKELELNTNEPANIWLDQPAGIYFVSAHTSLQTYFQQIEVR